MSEWIGRKYKGKASGRVFTILTEPFESDGKQWVGYVADGRDMPSVTAISEFTSDVFMTRILEPKYKLDQEVVHYSRKGRIIAIAPEVDNDDDFAYLVKYPRGEVDIAWETDVRAAV